VVLDLISSCICGFGSHTQLYLWFWISYTVVFVVLDLIHSCICGFGSRTQLYLWFWISYTAVFVDPAHSCICGIGSCAQLDLRYRIAAHVRAKAKFCVRSRTCHIYLNLLHNWSPRAGGLFRLIVRRSCCTVECFALRSPSKVPVLFQIWPYLA